MINFESNDPNDIFEYAINLQSEKSKTRQDLQLSAEIIKLLAENGYGEAQIAYAQILEISQKYEESDIIFENCKDLSPNGMYHYGRILELKGNYNKALEYYQKSNNQFANYHYSLLLDQMEHNNAQANPDRSSSTLVHYGMNYLLIQDYESSAKLFKAASDLDNTEAQYQLGKMLYEGTGLNRNIAQSAHYFQLAATKHHTKALVYYGQQLEHGKGIPVDLENAAICYRQAALQNDAKAQVLYGQMIEYGKLSSSFSINRRYIEAISKNNESEIFKCEMYFEFGNDRQSIIATALNYKEAHKNNNITLMNRYKEQLIKGEEKQSSISNAAKYYHLSSLQNDSDGLFLLGMLNEFGDGVPQNFTKAAECYQAAANLGHDGARFNLSRLVKYGDGIEQDQKRYLQLIQKDFDFNCFRPFIIYYRKMAEDNRSWAFARYGILLQYGIGIKQDEHLAALYYKLAADEGSVIGSVLFGHALEYGIGVTKSQKVAEMWYKNANYAKMAERKGILYAIYELLKKYSE
ncbi:SEL1-like repeat protein [Histomonas meleagridis]|uniref:SEL1-like repeat protein n=1 Tax=Histomonas meleagridis TaxID=135588 RepID=UPI0035598F7F|nr:SEL1-like repeat protein [Histomonas meleagridis]KAH0796336.1 SEL1-like repeat protein [Histomonas meleagridis]